jgi:hypothetical protein
MSPGSDLGVVPDTACGKGVECGEKILFCVLNLPRGVVPGFDRSADHGIAGHVIGTARFLRGAFPENIIIEEDVNRVRGVRLRYGGDGRERRGRCVHRFHSRAEASHG